MHHVFYFDGNEKKIAWTIQTSNQTIEQKREHAEIFLDKVTDLQSKYIALHVGLFWGIGTFIIKNGDSVLVKIDSDTMYEFITSNEVNQDELIKNRTYFIKHLIVQRRLKINYDRIEKKDNLARIVI